MEFIDLKSQYSALRETINARIQRVLDHGRYIMGPEVKELEEKLAAYTGAKHCITVASGTEALLISLMALDLKPGDEVITTPFTFAATVEMIMLLGGKPVFVDIEPDTCNIDARLIEARITSRTKAIMPVSLYGQCSDMDEINAIAASNRLPVIEDAAQSFGATYKGKKSCNLCLIGCTSFYPSKPLGCYGDGGAIFTSDDKLAKAMREIRVHGQERHYFHTRIGVGGRMDTLQCAVVLAKLERFEWEVQRRMEAGQNYTRLLREVPGISLLRTKGDRTNVFAQYSLLADDRSHVIASLKQLGIPTAVHYPKPLHLQPAYGNYRFSGTLKHAENAADRILSIPMYADLDSETQSAVVDGLRRALLTLA